MSKRTARLSTVAVVGVDGSGKSTQTALLREALARSGARVAVIHPYGWQFLFFLAPRSTHRSDSTGRAGGLSPRQRLVSGVVSAAELLDIGAYLWITHLRARVLSAQCPQTYWLLSDRSVVDVVVKHRRRRALPARVLQVWHRLVPHPRVTIWLSTDPAVAAQRDNDFPLSYYAESHRLYRHVSEEFGWQTVDTSDRTPEEVHSEILRTLGLRVRH